MCKTRRSHAALTIWLNAGFASNGSLCFRAVNGCTALNASSCRAQKAVPHAATGTFPLTFSRIMSSVAKSAALRKLPRPKSFSYESRSPSTRLNSGRQSSSRSACRHAPRSDAYSHIISHRGYAWYHAARSAL